MSGARDRLLAPRHPHGVNGAWGYRTPAIVGLAAFAMPVAVVLVGLGACTESPLLPTLSDYVHHARAGLAFMVPLWIVGLFLLVAYRGHTLLDALLSLLAGAGAIMAAVFQVAMELCITDRGPWADRLVVRELHYAGAIALFVSAWAFCRCSFPRCLVRARTPGASWRRTLFLRCARVIAVSAVLLGVAFGFEDALGIEGLPVIALLETVMLFAFGTAWLVHAGLTGNFLDELRYGTERSGEG
ncbi:MAG: hypothetical protein AAGH15_20040 [Myxococcota bacterium]